MNEGVQIIMNNKKKLSYKRYKRRQRWMAVVLLLSVIFFIALGFIVGWNSKDTYTIYTLPEDLKPSIDEIFLDDNEHKCSKHTHQVYEEVVSYPDGSVLRTCSCIEVVDEEELEQEHVSNFYIELTEEEKHELACLIYLEGRGESVECQTAIGSVVLNRYTTGDYNSLHDVIYAQGQFTPAYLIDDTEPTITQIQIVNDLCMNGPTVPEYVTYFRANKYHTWSSTEPYKQIDSTYFSASKKLREAIG